MLAGLLALALGVGVATGGAPAGAAEPPPSTRAAEGGAPEARAVDRATLVRNFG